MEDVDLRHAKEHLEELLERASRGEDVRITDPKLGTIRLTLVGASMGKPDRPKRVPGLLKGKLPPPPDDFFDPMTEEELKDWYGDDT